MSRGLHAGPDLVSMCLEPLPRVVIGLALLLACPMGATMAGVTDGPDGIDPLGHRVTFQFARPMESIGPFEFAPSINVTPMMLKGATPVMQSFDPEARCTPEEKNLCKQDCMDSHQQYAGCERKTVEGRMTRICTCIDPALRAALWATLDACE